jgi:hypothetical protein
MKLKSKAFLVFLATSSMAFAQTAPVTPTDTPAPETTIAFNAGVVSQYRYRGLAQTKGQPALQGGVDYTNANGAYLGAWASTIKWIQDASQSDITYRGSVELDLYGGYKFESNGIAYDLGYLRYEYLGNNLANTTTKTQYANANTDEVYGAGTFGNYTLKYSQTLGNLFGTVNSKSSKYIDLTANFDLGNGYVLSPHAGHQRVANQTPSMSYSDLSLTLTKDLGDGLSISASAITNNGRSNIGGTSGVNVFSSNKSSYNTAQDALVIGAKYSF